MAKTQTAVEKDTSAETQPEDGSIIARVYLLKNTGHDILEGPDAENAVKEIRKESDGDDSPYTFYEEDGTPVYIAVKNQKYEPISFPEPGSDIEKGQAGMTSMELYSKAVTLANTIEKIIELETAPKPSLIDQAKKIMTPTIAIVACVFVIFLIVAMM